jgi:glucokinase
MTESEPGLARRVAAGNRPRGGETRCALVADIGGTTSRFALVDAAGHPDRMQIIANESVDSLQTALRNYLATIPVQPSHAMLAVAAAVAGNEITLTNRAWRFRPDELRAQFGFAHVRVVNDFEALAWGVPRLTSEDIRQIGRAPAVPGGTRAVIGPGTGLGVAALARVAGSDQVVASEGGHIAFGPTQADEVPIFDAVRAELGYVSAEALLSGAGLMRLHAVLAPSAPRPDTTRAIVAAAQAGEPGAVAAARMFARLLGRFAGDAVLMFKATGGVYIAGGVARALGDFLDETHFRTAFEAHPPYQRLLADVPTLLITRKEPGLLGSAALAQRLLAETE